MQKSWQGHRKKKADTKTEGGNHGPIPDPTKVEGGTGATAMWQPEAHGSPSSSDFGRREQASQGGASVLWLRIVSMREERKTRIGRWGATEPGPAFPHLGNALNPLIWGARRWTESPCGLGTNTEMGGCHTLCVYSHLPNCLEGIPCV
jgi:hypothetical protein